MKLSKFLLGSKLGEGAHRTVYELRLNPDFVIKVAKGYYGIESNINEWQLWDNCKHSDWYKPLRDWLAPCECISECGKFLVMHKAEALRKEQAPKIVPACLTDLKLENLGLYKGRTVFIDYGMQLILEEAIENKKARIVPEYYWNSEDY